MKKLAVDNLPVIYRRKKYHGPGIFCTEFFNDRGHVLYTVPVTERQPGRLKTITIEQVKYRIEYNEKTIS